MNRSHLGTAPAARRCGSRRGGALVATLALTLLAACGNADQPAAPEEADLALAKGTVEALATDADPRTLFIVGTRYATGDGVPEDQDIAERLWKVACDKGHAFACSNYGSRLIGAGDYDAAATYLARAGEAGVIDAIQNLIELHDNPGWSGASVDESVRWQRARDVLQAPAQSPVPDAPDPDAPN